jgi:hypothetical protein
MYNNIVFSRSLDIVFKRINFSILEKLAVQFVICLYFIQV